MVDGKEVARILADNRTLLSERRAMWERYGGKAPIHSRQYQIDGKPVKGKVCRRIGNDFVGEIVDDKVGFVVGNPVAYSGPDTLALFLERWKDWCRNEGTPDWDADWVLDASLCGVGYRVLYRQANEPTMLKLKQLPPFEVVDWEDEEGRHALRYWQDSSKTPRATYYGPRTIVEFTGTKGRGIGDAQQDSSGVVFVSDGQEVEHIFPGCPVVPLENNSRRLGDCAKVLGLIDQVDRILSDASSEVEQFRLAYVALMGDKSPVADESRRQFLEKMRESGIMFLPSGSDAKFITKAMDIGGLKILVDILIDHIYRFAKAVNPSKADTNTTTVALRQRMHAVRNKCLVLERKMTWAIREQARLASGIWSLIFGEPVIQPADLEVVFTENFPVNLVEEAQFLQMTDGQLSQETRLSAVSLVDDPAAEIERMAAEQQDADQIMPPVGMEREAALEPV